MLFTKKTGLILLFCFAVACLSSQENAEPAPAPGTASESPPKTPSFGIGVETDLLAWRIGELFESYYLGAWLGLPHWKFGLTGAAMELNPGHLPDGVARDYTLLAQLRADWSPSADRMGFWIGPSMTYEYLRITSTQGMESEVPILAAGLTAGYLLKSGKFYFGPSLAVHFTLGTPVFALNDAETAPAPPWSFETGFRFGYAF
jgi:hypothetical protein